MCVVMVMGHQTLKLKSPSHCFFCEWVGDLKNIFKQTLILGVSYPNVSFIKQTTDKTIPKC